jgi:AbrB family looped-hinge helix DNA binding protein
MPSTVTTKGQVTIPKEVRELLGIKPGNAVAFEVDDDGRVVVAKVGRRGAANRPLSRFAKLRGSATAGMTTDEIMALTRGEG